MVKIKKKPLTKSFKKKKSTMKKPPKKDQWSSMSVDTFLNKNFENSESEEENETQNPPSEEEDNTEELNEENGTNQSESDPENESEDEIEKHKVALDKLKDTDPEFYKFLQENDKQLLDFNVSDSEEAEEDEDEDQTTPHKPPQELEVASDESDFEEEGKITKVKDHGTVTLKMLKTWQTDIQKDKSKKTITALTQAFHAALMRVSSEEDQPSLYKVEGSAVFNGVIQLCVIHLGPALRRFLGIVEGSKQPPHKCKKFTKIKKVLKDYFLDLSKLLSGVTSANIQTVLLKHLHYMSPFIISYPNITKTILKRVISIWGKAEEGVRVLAFFCILRITNNQKTKFLDTVLKSMYMTYVKNSKFVSVNSLASINFMRRSLVEMFALDANVAYQHVFLYIRQLAIHLRNAITVNKKENIQAVYNWQFINSLKLWGSLLSLAHNKSQLQQLLYPFVQVSLGVIKLVPTTQYYPLRFHVVQTLMDLSRDSGIFIPVLPFILEVLTSYDFNKKHQKVSMKVLQFTCILRASKSQMAENGFKDALIETIYGLLLEYLAVQSNSISFPDLSLLCTLQIKQFTKKCQNVNYTRKLKQLLEKIDQNRDFIENERSKLTLNITDFKQIEGWEAQIKSKGTPLSKFFEEWHKLHTIKKNKQLTNNEELADYKLPIMKKKVTEKKKVEGPVELFPSDSEDDESPVEQKRKRGKRGGKNVNKKIKDESGPVHDDGQPDLVEDINDW